MEKVVRKFSSFAEAEEAEIEEDLAIPPAKRIEILLELIHRVYPDASEQRLARVCRIIKRQES
jgi:hypothetical protein